MPEKNDGYAGRDGCGSWAGVVREKLEKKEGENILLLEVVLPAAASIAAREGTFVVAFAGVDANMASEMAAGGEGFVASGTDMVAFFLDPRRLGELGRVLGRGIGQLRLLLLLLLLLEMVVVVVVVVNGMLLVMGSHESVVVEKRDDPAVEASTDEHYERVEKKKGRRRFKEGGYQARGLNSEH